MTVLNLQVLASSDDARESGAGAVAINGATLALSSGSAWLGFRFNSVTIPQGSTINSAGLEVYVDSTAADDPDVDIYCEDADDAGTFTTGANDISSRSLTTAKTNWSAGGVGAGFKTAGDITSAVQEVINRGGWSSGNDLVVIFDSLSSSNLTIRAYDSNPAEAATLVIDYTDAGGGGGGSVASTGVSSSVVTYEVWLLDPFGNLLDVIDEWLYLRYDRALNNVGSLELGLDGSYPNFNFIKLDGRIVVWRNGKIDMETTWLIRRIIRTLDEEGTLGISIGAFSANELLNRRIVAYDAGTSYAEKVSMAADNMMKQVIRENFGASASVAARNISTYFSVEADTSQGPSLTKSIAWNNILDVTQDIALTTISAGSAVYFDVISPAFNTFEFRTYRGQRGIDHTFLDGQSPVVLSPDRGNLTSVLRSFDYSDEVTYVYAGGAGFNQFQFVATASHAGRINQSPLNRREMFLSSGGIAQAVIDDAQAGLRENRPRRVFQGKLVNVPGTTEYGIHWNFGDLVTVEFEGETIDCSIDAVQIEVADGEENITATLRALET